MERIVPVIEVIDELRRKKGLKWKDLAAKAGLAKITLSKLKQHKVRQPHLNTLLKIAQVLEVPFETLVRSEPIPQP